MIQEQHKQQWYQYKHGSGHSISPLIRRFINKQTICPCFHHQYRQTAANANQIRLLNSSICTKPKCKSGNAINPKVKKSSISLTPNIRIVDVVDVLKKALYTLSKPTTNTNLLALFKKMIRNDEPHNHTLHCAHFNRCPSVSFHHHASCCHCCDNLNNSSSF
jgi:hypothetical protein